jgi:hypothetical protein
MNYFEIKSLYAAKGFPFYESGKYNINLYGRRNKDLTTINKFNDVLGVAYVDGFGKAQCLEFEGTTKPGLSWLGDKVGNPKGTFILMPGNHKKAWMIGLHHVGQPNQYEAFVQRTDGVFRGWRDGDKDGKFDFDGPIYTDVRGLNGHRAGINETDNVGLYSAACQVVADDKEHSIWLSIGKRCAELYGNAFDYTLFQD